MSKSDENVNSFISLKDDKDTILRKFRRAVTDSEAQVRYAEGKDGINNLMEIYAAVTGKANEEIEAEYEKLAKNYELDVEKVKSFIPKEELVKDIAVEKAIQVVRDNAVVTEADEAEDAKAEDAKDAE